MSIDRAKYRVWSVASYVVVSLMVIFVVGAAALAYFFFAKFDKALESDLVVYNSIPSPDGKLSAVIYELEGGATAPLNTQVSIAPADTPFAPKNNPSFLALEGQHNLVVRWIGERAVEVVGVPQDVKIYKKDPSVGDVTVEYR